MSTKIILSLITIWTGLNLHGQVTDWESYYFDLTVNSIPSSNVFSVVETSDGSIYAGTLRGLGMYDGVEWTNRGSAFGVGTVRDIAPGVPPLVWMATSSLAYKNDTLTPYYFTYNENNTSLPDVNYLAVLLNEDQELYAGSEGGGLIYHPDTLTWVVYNTQNSPLPNDTVNDLVYAADGSLWIATNGGVAILKDDQWNHYSTANSGLPDNHVNVIRFNGSGTPWFGTDAGLARLDNGIWNVYTVENAGFVYNKISSLAFQDDATLWIGFQAFGFASFINGVVTNYTTSNTPMTFPEVRDIMVDSEGKKWIATRDGLFSFRNLTAVTATEQSALAIYPNPAGESVNIRIPQGGGELFILDLQGRQWHHEWLPGGMQQVSTVNFSRGYYLVRVISDNAIQTGKLIIR